MIQGIRGPIFGNKLAVYADNAVFFLQKPISSLQSFFEILEHMPRFQVIKLMKENL